VFPSMLHARVFCLWSQRWHISTNRTQLLGSLALITAKRRKRPCRTTATPYLGMYALETCLKPWSTTNPTGQDIPAVQIGKGVMSGNGHRRRIRGMRWKMFCFVCIILVVMGAIVGGTGVDYSQSGKAMKALEDRRHTPLSTRRRRYLAPPR
jgi:hypothetical protein